MEMRQMLGFRGTNSKDTSDSSTKSLSQSPQSSSPTVVAAGPVRPLRLIYCDEKGKFRMDPEAVAALQHVKGPVGVISVCGQARQGKSFILNQRVLREEHRGIVQKTLAAFNASAVRVGLAQQKYEKLIQQFFNKAFEIVVEINGSDMDGSEHWPTQLVGPNGQPFLITAPLVTWANPLNLHGVI